MLNTLKRDLKAGKHSLGTVITFSCPALAEIFAMCGYEWIWYDLEHTPMSLETLNMMLQASSAFPATPVVRVPIADEVTIKRILDLGVHAIIAPLIDTPAQAREGVKAMKYPPLGVRGVGLGRAQGYGEADWGGYFGEANEQTMFIAQIESAESVDNIDEILAVEGVDAIFLGTLDLSGSVAQLGHTDDPRVEAAQMKVLEACHKAGKPAGILAMSPEQAVQRVRQGLLMVGLGIDVDSIFTMAKDGIQKMRKELNS